MRIDWSSKMNLFLKLVVIVLVIRKTECDGECHSTVTFLRKNITFLDNFVDNFTEAKRIIKNNVECNAWNQIVIDNKTNEEEHLPHDVVPKISKYEKGDGS